MRRTSSRNCEPAGLTAQVPALTRVAFERRNRPLKRLARHPTLCVGNGEELVGHVGSRLQEKCASRPVRSMQELVEGSAAIRLRVSLISGDAPAA
jgi:hypothetical protein